MRFRSTTSRLRRGRASAASIRRPVSRSPASPISTATAPTIFSSYNPTNGALNAFEVHNFTATAWQGVGSIDPAGGNAIAGTGDYNGDGTADVLFYDQITGGVHAFEVHNFIATQWQGVGGVATEWHVV